MSLKRLLKKSLMGGGNLIRGHITDAVSKKLKTGKSFRECLNDSINETLHEDMPGISHIYQSGRKDGRIQGTAEQAKRDEKKFQDQERAHNEDRKQWNKQMQQYEDLLDDIEKDM